MAKSRKRKLQPIQNWFNISPPRGKASVFRISAPPFMSKKPTLSALGIPLRMESNKWLPFVSTPRRPVSYFWGDYDGDGVYNGLDCAPRNKRRQGEVHEGEENIMNRDKDARKERERIRLRLSKYKKHIPFRKTSDPFQGYRYSSEADLIADLDKIEQRHMSNEKIGKLARPEIFNQRRLQSVKAKIDIAREEKKRLKEQAWDKVKEKFGMKDANISREQINMFPRHSASAISRELKKTEKEIILNERRYNAGLNVLREKLNEPVKAWRGRFGDPKPITTDKIKEYTEEDIIKMAPVESIVKEEKEIKTPKERIKMIDVEDEEEEKKVLEEIEDRKRLMAIKGKTNKEDIDEEREPTIDEMADVKFEDTEDDDIK